MLHFQLGEVLSPKLVRSPGCCAQVEYPEIDEGEKPRHRFMSAFEQKKEASDKAYQYLLFAAEPYEVIAFKVPNMEVDRTARFFNNWCGRLLMHRLVCVPSCMLGCIMGASNFVCGLRVLWLTSPYLSSLPLVLLCHDGGAATLGMKAAGGMICWHLGGRFDMKKSISGAGVARRDADSKVYSLQLPFKAHQQRIGPSSGPANSMMPQVCRIMNAI